MGWPIDLSYSIAHDEPEDADCPNCGGEGFYADCFEEYVCIDPEGGCDLCMRRCDWCNKRQKTLPA